MSAVTEQVNQHLKSKADYVSFREAKKQKLSGYLGTEIVDPRVKVNNLTDQDIEVGL